MEEWAGITTTPTTQVLKYVRRYDHRAGTPGGAFLDSALPAYQTNLRGWLGLNERLCKRR